MIAQHFIDIQQKRKPDPADCKVRHVSHLYSRRSKWSCCSPSASFWTFSPSIWSSSSPTIPLSPSLNLSKVFVAFLFFFLVSDEVQCAWRFANDSYRFPSSLFTSSIYSTASIQYTAKTIAAACVYLAIRVLKKMPPENAVPTLLDMCGTDETVLMRCCDCLKALYPNFDKQFLCRVCWKANEHSTGASKQSTNNRTNNVQTIEQITKRSCCRERRCAAHRNRIADSIRTSHNSAKNR